MPGLWGDRGKAGQAAGTGTWRSSGVYTYRLSRYLPGNPTNLLLRLRDNTDKAKPAERRRRKATGPRFLREATEDLPKDPKTAELPIHEVADDV